MTDAAVRTIVIRIDLRASAAGPEAVEADSFGPDTLITIQRGVIGGNDNGNGNGDGGVGPPGPDDRHRFVDVGRILVLDDTATFAKHETVYQFLATAPTVGQLLCLVVGEPVEHPVGAPVAGEPVPSEPVIELPTAATLTNAAVLWVGDPRGVGWRLGMQTTTRLAVGDPADPDGNIALAELSDLLTEHELYDRMFAAISELSGRVGAPATLPTIRWVLPVVPIRARPPAPVEVPPDPEPAMWRLSAFQLFLLALGSALIALVPPWVIALAPWILVPVIAARVGRGRCPHAQLVPNVALAAAAATIGSAIGAFAAATDAPLSHLGVPAVEADSASASLGAVMIAVAFIASIVEYTRRQHANRAVLDSRTAADPPVPAALDVSPPDEAEESARTAMRKAIVEAACRTISAGAEDEGFLQLNAPEQLPLLDGAPQQARLIPFAPETARETITRAMADDVVGKAVAGNDVEWMPSGDRIGILRLVPVRPGMLRTSGISAVTGQTSILVDVTGGDRARAMLATWLRGDGPGGSVTLSDAGGPITVRLPDLSAARALTMGTAHWLGGKSDQTTVTFTRPDEGTKTLTAAEVKTATDQEVDDSVTRIAHWLIFG